MNLNKIFDFFSRESSLRKIILVACVLRLSLFFISQLWYEENVIKENFVGADSEGYHVLTVNLLKTGSFETFGTFRTPLYPGYIAIFYSIFGPYPWIPIFFQTFIDLISVWLVFKIGKKIFDLRIGLLAALLYSLDPHIILFSTTLQSDTLFVFVFLSSIYLFLRALEEYGWKYYALSGLVLGVATLIRPITQFFPVVLLIILFFHFKEKWFFKAKAAAVLLLCFALGIGPWLYRNYTKYGHVALSSIQGANLLFYSAAYAEVVKTGKNIEQVREDFSKQAALKGADERYNPVFPLTEEELWNYGENMKRDRHNPFQNASIYNKIASDYIKSNLQYYIPRHIQGVMNMYFALESRGISYRLGLNTQTFKFDYFASPGLIPMIKNFIKSKPIGGLLVGFFVAIFIMINYLFFFYGAVRMIMERKYFYLFTLLCFIGYFSAIVGVVGLARYKMPIIPFYSMIAAYGIFQFATWYLNKKQRKTKVQSVTY